MLCFQFPYTYKRRFLTHSLSMYQFPLSEGFQLLSQSSTPERSPSLSKYQVRIVILSCKWISFLFFIPSFLSINTCFNSILAFHRSFLFLFYLSLLYSFYRFVSVLSVTPFKQTFCIILLLCLTTFSNAVLPSFSCSVISDTVFNMRPEYRVSVAVPHPVHIVQKVAVPVDRPYPVKTPVHIPYPVERRG